MRDEVLRSKGFATPQRPIHAFLEISRTLGLRLELPVHSRDPQLGVYTGHDMTIRIFKWYDEHYGPSHPLAGLAV